MMNLFWIPSWEIRTLSETMFVGSQACPFREFKGWVRSNMRDDGLVVEFDSARHASRWAPRSNLEMLGRVFPKEIKHCKRWTQGRPKYNHPKRTRRKRADENTNHNWCWWYMPLLVLAFVVTKQVVNWMLLNELIIRFGRSVEINHLQSSRAQAKGDVVARSYTRATLY